MSDRNRRPDDNANADALPPPTTASLSQGTTGVTIEPSQSASASSPAGRTQAAAAAATEPGAGQTTTTEQGFDEKLRALHQNKAPDEPLFTWGYHQLWHGDMARERINAISSERPIVVWHRSFHELYMNDGALAMAGINDQDIRPGSQIDFLKGKTKYAFWRENFPDETRSGLNIPRSQRLLAPPISMLPSSDSTA